MRVIVPFILSALFAAALAGNSVDRSDEAQSIVSLGSPLPVEYQASAVFQLLETGNLPNRKVRDPILLQLFDRAADSVSPFPAIYVATDGNDTLEGRSAFALQSTGLSGFQIRLDVIRYLSKDSIAKAMELLDEMQPSPPSVDCGAALVPDASQFFARVKQLFEAFDKQYPARHSQAVDWLNRQIEKGSTFNESAAALELIESVKLKDDERQSLIQTVSARLTASSPPSRDFSLETKSQKVGKTIRRVAEQDYPAVAGLTSAYETVLLKLLSQRACVDQVTRQGEAPSPIEAAALFFKTNLMPPQSRASEIDEELRKVSAAPGDTWAIHPLDELAQFGGLFRKLFALRDGPAGYIPTENELPPNSLGWEADADTMLQKLSQWNESKADCPTCVFLRKSVMYASLLDLLPPGRVADRCIDEYLDYMASSEVQLRSPASWIMSFRLFLMLLRQPSSEEKQAMMNAKKAGKLLGLLPSPFARQALDKALQSTNARIRYLTQVEQFAPMSYVNPAVH